MKELHIEPIVFTARLFTEGRSFSNVEDEYEAILTIQKMGSVALLSGCKGDLDLWAYRELMKRLKALGVETIHWMRGDKEIVKDMVG